jgi:hypothetical protein
MSIIKDFWMFISVRKKYFLLPFVVAAALVGVLFFVSDRSAVAPFTYSLF